MIELMRAIAVGDRRFALALIESTPSLATAGAVRSQESFLVEGRAQIYEGDTALHAAAFVYDVVMARDLVARGADIRARNRRGGEPLHAAAMGGPGSAVWRPAQQRVVVRYLVEAGADPNATAVGGVTPLHRAVRNRCSSAVEELLDAGADPYLANDKGSTAFDLVKWTTGRGGTGSDEAKAEQRLIIDLLDRAASR
jgi:ankyrin repeat protein